MDKILETYKDIQVAKAKNSIKISGLFVLVIVLIASFSIASVKMFNKALLNTQILEYDGHVRNPIAIHPDSASVIRCKAFIDDFCQHFFSFNPLNLPDNLEYALELGDNSIKNAYRAFMSRNWYNDIIQNNLFQECQISRLSCDPYNDHFKIFAEALISIQDISSSQAIYYKVRFTCKAVPVKPSFPKFKQGLFINEFVYDINEFKL